MGLDLHHVVPSDSEQHEYFELEELKGSQEFITEHIHLFVEIKDEELNDKKKVLYWKEIGYQRKGMSNKFFNDFENDLLYFELYIVKKAFEYLKADHINSLKELQLKLKKNFIDNFVEGESIFFASW